MKHQKIFVVLLTCLFIAAILLGNEINLHAQTNAPARQSPAPRIADCDNSPLAELDKFIQLRFHERADSFGISRVLPTTYHLRENPTFAAVHFAPRNDKEIFAINVLRDEGWKIGLFLVGRSILDKKPAKEIWENPNNDFYARKPINNPILITPQTKVEELPQPAELWDEAQKAMKAFRKNKQQYDFTAGKWEMTARPIRASEQACLRCHVSDTSPQWFGGLRMASLDKSGQANAKITESLSVSLLKIGDPLGMALYAYKRKQ